MPAKVIPLPVPEPHPRRFRFGKQSLTRATEAYGRTKSVTLRDTDLRGFICRKQTRAWVLGVERRIQGKLHRVSICEFTPATKPGAIDSARTEAASIMAHLAAGTYLSPTAKAEQSERSQQLAALTIYHAPDFHARENPHVRESTLRNYRSAVKRMFQTDVRVADITAEMVRDEYRRMLDVTSAASASNALRSVRALWQSWADAHPDGEEPTSNPVKRLTAKRKAVQATAPREGSLTPAQRPLWWTEAQRLATHAGPTGSMYRALQLLFLTGLRLNEGLRLRWDEVGETTLTIEADRMKAGVPLTRPITAGMHAILDAQAGLSEEWVFPARRGDGSVTAPGKALARIGVGDISPHDLRRTYISTAETLGVPTVVTKMLVGHSVADITESYARALRSELPEFAARIEEGLLS